MASRVTACPSCGTKNRVPVASGGRPQCASCHATLPWLVDATDDNFDKAVETGQLVLVDLWAPWCGPCRMVAPILERIATQYAGRVKVVKVNVDDNPHLASRFEAQSIPTLVMLRDGKSVARLIGAQPEPTLRQHIDRLLGA